MHTDVHRTAPNSQPGAQPAATQQADLPKLFQGRLRPLHSLYRSFELWSDADGLRMAAAMSFYGMLSLAPLLVLIVAVLGIVLDRSMMEAELLDQIQSVVGAQGAEVVRAAMSSAKEPGSGTIASVIAFGVLVAGATGVFAELQSAFERLWRQGTGGAAAGAWWHKATVRLRGVAYVLALGFLMLVSLVISSAVGIVEKWVGTYLEARLLLIALNYLVSLALTVVLFVAMMRISAGPQPRMRHLVMGATVGGVLFGVGKYAMALYLSTAAVVSSYGAAGSLVVLLMWIYFASAVLLYGASVARVLAERHGDFGTQQMPLPAAAVTGLQAQARDALQSAPLASPLGAPVTAVLPQQATLAGATAATAAAASPGGRDEWLALVAGVLLGWRAGRWWARRGR
jgi:membrane protein